MKELSIAWISAACYAHTGYGRICKEVVSRLIANGWNVINIGGIGGTTVWGGKMDYPVTIREKTFRGHEDGKEEYDEQTVNIPVLPTVGQLAGQDVIHAFIDKYGLDLLVTHWDSFAIDYVQHLKIPAINYLPIDALFTQKMHNNVKESYKVVAMAKYGFKELLKWLPPEKLGYIPHGINTDEWKPAGEATKKKTREDWNIGENDFVIVTNGANMGERKQLPLMLQVFKKFLKKHPQSWFLMFTNPTVQFPKGYDLRGFADSLGITDRVFFPRYDPILEPWSNEQLINFYSIGDVYLTATLGEGFGIPILESMACGTPVIAPRCSTMPELVDGQGWIYDTCDNFTFTPVWIPTLQSYPAPDATKMLETLYHVKNNKSEIDYYSKCCREFSLRYDWREIIPQWENLLLKAEEDIKIQKGL